MILWMLLWDLALIFTLSSTAPSCRLGQDLLNSLVNAMNKDGEEFGIEIAYGLIGNGTTDKLNLTSEEFQDCIQNYHKTNPSIQKNTQIPPAVNLHYEKPGYLGSRPQLPVPVPDDEDYLPGKEGYTTYINPYNFKVTVYNSTEDRASSSEEFLETLFLIN